jgi:hypothetical protein
MQGHVSCHSNQNNVSVQRSAVTTATAGSDVGTGKLSCCGNSTPLNIEIIFVAMTTYLSLHLTLLLLQ